VIEHGAIERALAALPPAEQLGAGRDAAELARRLEFLPWADRAAVLDDYYPYSCGCTSMSCRPQQQA
jgi:hypothetical protein